MSAFWSRIVVGAAGLPVVLGIVWLGGWWLFLLGAVVGLIALHEFFWLTRPLRPVPLVGYAGLIGVLLAVQLSGLVWAVAALAGTVICAFLLKGVADTRGSVTVAVATTALGVAWIGIGLASVLLLRDLPEHGRLASYTLLLAIFADDTAAYFGGRVFGRHKLAPSISPGKTWEGWLFGRVAGLLVVFFALYDTRRTFLSIGEALLVGLAIVAAGPVGDLFESAVKRDMKVKDSGRLLGGHGGMLDRIDSILLGAPAAYFVILALLR